VNRNYIPVFGTVKTWSVQIELGEFAPTGNFFHSTPERPQNEAAKVGISALGVFAGWFQPMRFGSQL